MSQKNILEVCLSPDFGGLELFMISCVKNFSMRTNIFTAIATNKKLDNYLKSDNCFRLKRNKILPIIPALKLAKYIDEKNIDIIHFHWTKDMLLVVLAKVLSNRKPKIVQSRHMTMTRFKGDFYHKWLYKNIDTLHAVTFQVKEQLEKFIPLNVQPKIEVVHPGTMIPSINQIRADELRKKYALGNSFVIGMIGRIEEAKGQHLLLEALSKLKTKNIKVVIVGATMNEGYLVELKNHCKTMKIENQVIFTGFTKEVNEHIQLCDITVLATPKETFGLVLIEAMMNKVCVIATNKAGPLEIIDDGETGLLFDRSAKDLASKIKLLYENYNFKEKLALAGYKKAKEKFNSNIQLEKIYKVIYEN